MDASLLGLGEGGVKLEDGEETEVVKERFTSLTDFASLTDVAASSLLKHEKNISNRATHEEDKKNYLCGGTVAFAELKPEKLRERGLKPGNFGKKLGLGIKPPVVLGSAGATFSSPALGPTLLTLELTAAVPASAPLGSNDGLGGWWGSDCCCFDIICIGERGGEEGMIGLGAGVPWVGDAGGGIGFEKEG